MCLVLLCRHATDVDELHEEVLHTPASTPALAVCSPTPKLSPLTVTDASPLNGAFSSIPDATATSNVNEACLVPGVAPTVIVTSVTSKLFDGDRHATDVPELQDDVKHISADSFTDAVSSPLPKFRPVTVTDAPPQSGVFRYE
jgi:hypothetical protein